MHTNSCSVWVVCSDFGVAPSIPTVCRALASVGFSRKRLYTVDSDLILCGVYDVFDVYLLVFGVCCQLALEADHTVRAQYWANIAPVIERVEQLVFVDETGADSRSIGRNYGYGLRGRRARAKKTFVRGMRYNVAAAVDIDGLLDYELFNHTLTAADFNHFFEHYLLRHLNPYPADRSVVIMDNASIHDRVHLQAMCDAVGVLLIWLPPYSPDFNPIELSFRTLKEFIRAHKALWRADSLRTLMEGLDFLRYDHTLAFDECGYSDALFSLA